MDEYLFQVQLGQGNNFPQQLQVQQPQSLPVAFNSALKLIKLSPEDMDLVVRSIKQVDFTKPETSELDDGTPRPGDDDAANFD